MNMKKLDEIAREKMTITEICNRLNISRSSWYRWLRGEHNMSLARLKEVCELLGIDINEVIK